MKPIRSTHLLILQFKIIVALLSSVIILLLSSITAQAEVTEKESKHKVVIETNLGNITIELESKKSPITVHNFLAYVEDSFYDGLIFHRVIPNFMIQGGGFDAKMAKKATRDPIKNEAKNGLDNLRGTIAMARTSVVDSATSQFFINLVDNSYLNHGVRDYGYTVFGRVTEGMDIVDKIANTPTKNQGIYRNMPVQTVLIKTIRMINIRNEAKPELLQQTTPAIQKAQEPNTNTPNNKR